MGQASAAVRSSSRTLSPISRVSMWLVSDEHRVQIDRPDGEHLLAAEGQELAGQVAAAAGRLLNLAQVAPRRAGVGRLGQEHVGVALDHHEDVVEVVGHAAGQVADGFELLGLPQLGLQPPAVLGFGLERQVGRRQGLRRAGPGVPGAHRDGGDGQQEHVGPGDYA